MGICGCAGVSLLISGSKGSIDVFWIRGNIGGRCLRSMWLVLNHVLITESVQIVNIVKIFNELLKVDLDT
jgi:hypothetical protein